MLKFAKKVISCLIITSLVLMDVASCMEEPPKTPTMRSRDISRDSTPSPDSDTPPKKNSPSSHSSSDGDSLPHLTNGLPIVQPDQSGSGGQQTHSAPSILITDPSSERQVVILDRGSSSLPRNCQSVSARKEEQSDSLASPFPSPNLGRVSSADMRLLNLGDPHQAQLKQQFKLSSQQIDHFFQATRGSSPSFLAFLHDQVIHRKLSEWQWAAAITGVRMGLGVGLATSPVTIVAIGKYLNQYTNNAFYGTTPADVIIQGLTYIVHPLAASAKMVPIFIRWAGVSEDEFNLPKSCSHKCANLGNLIGIYLVGGIASGFFAFYLFYDATKQGIEEDAADTAGFIGYFVASAPAYLFYALPFNSDSIFLDVKDFVNEWFYEPLRKGMPQVEGLEADRIRLLNVLKERLRLVDILKADKLKALWNLISQSLEDTPEMVKKVTENFWYLKEGARFTKDQIEYLLKNKYLNSEEEEEAFGDEEIYYLLTEKQRMDLINQEIKKAETLRVVAIMLSLQGEVPPEDLQLKKKSMVSWGGLITTGLATPGRFKTFAWLIGLATGRGTWGALPIIGSLVTNVFLGATEYKRVKQYLSKFMGIKNIEDSRSRPTTRKVVTGMNLGFFGPLYTASFGLACTFATAPWTAPGWIPFLGMSILAEVFRNAGMFEQPTQDLITGHGRYKAWRNKGMPVNEEDTRLFIKEILIDLMKKFKILNHENLKIVLKALKFGNFGDPQQAPSPEKTFVKKENEVRTKQTSAQSVLVKVRSSAKSQDALLDRKQGDDLKQALLPVASDASDNHYSYDSLSEDDDRRESGKKKKKGSYFSPASKCAWLVTFLWGLLYLVWFAL